MLPVSLKPGKRSVQDNSIRNPPKKRGWQMGLFPKEPHPARFIWLSIHLLVGVVERVRSFLSALAVELSICHNKCVNFLRQHKVLQMPWEMFLLVNKQVLNLPQPSDPSPPSLGFSLVNWFAVLTLNALRPFWWWWWRKKELLRIVFPMTCFRCEGLDWDLYRMSLISPV